MFIYICICISLAHISVLHVEKSHINRYNYFCLMIIIIIAIIYIIITVVAVVVLIIIHEWVISSLSLQEIFAMCFFFQ